MGRTGLTTAGAALSALMLAAVTGAVPSSGTQEQQDQLLAIGQLELGNVFVDQTRARFALEGATAGSYRVVDERGAHVLEGRVRPGQEELVLPRLELGQYVLEVAGQDGEVVRTNFALIQGWQGERDERFAVNTKFGLPREGQAPVWDPEQQAYDPVGVPEHEQAIVPLLSQTGVSQIRDTIAWNQFEPEERLYTGGPPWYGEYLHGAAEEDITPLVILSYGNKLYDVDEEGIGAAPYTEEGIQAYAEYARAVLSSYDGVVQEVEVWNEYNGDAPWNRGPCRRDARCYYEMLKVTHEVVKETHPEARIVGPAAVTLPYNWLEELFSYGALDYLDAVTVHPYGIPASPETGYPPVAGGTGRGLPARIDQLDALVREYNDGQSKPIWFTEVGWGSYSPGRGVTESTQADYLVRTHVLSLASGVDRIHWYSLRNSTYLPSGPGANWGMLRAPEDPMGYSVPKESYGAYTQLTRQLSGADWVQRDPAPNGVYSHEFARPDGESVRVLWGIGARQDVTLRTAEPLVVTSIDGQERTLHPHEGVVHLTAGSDPVYVAGPVQEVSGPGSMSLTTPGPVTRGEPLTATFTLESTGRPGATAAQVTVEGTRRTVVVRPGDDSVQAEFVVPTDSATERRTVTAEVRVRGKLVGWLAADSPVN